MMMMMSSTVNKQAHLNQLNALGASQPTKKPKAEAAPKVDLVDAKADTFELATTPREAVADAQATPPPALQEAPQKQNSFLAIGSGIIAIASAIGAGVAFHKAGVAEEGLTALKKEVESNKALATAAESAANVAKGIADKAQAAAQELAETVSGKDSKSGLVKEVETLSKQSQRIGSIVETNAKALLGRTKKTQASDILPTDMPILLESLSQSADAETKTNTLKLIFQALESSDTVTKAANFDELYNHAVSQATLLPQRGSIKTNNNPNVRNAGKVLSAVLEVQAELASILPKEGADAAATATNATEYKAALKALVDKLITSKKLNDADQQTLKALESLLGGFTKETPSADVRTVIHTNIGKQLKALEGFQKQPLLPHYDELVTTVKDSQDKDVKAFVRDLPAHQIEIFTERMLNAGTLDPINAQAITVMSDFNKNADLLKLVADNLAQASADQKHPLHGIQTARTESLRNAVEAFAGGIDTNTDGAAAKAIAEKLAKVLGELRNPTKDPAQNASTLATTLGLNVDADKSHLDLLVKHHGNNNNVETIAKYLSEQLTAIQAAPKPVVQTTP